MNSMIFQAPKDYESDASSSDHNNLLPSIEK